MFSALLDAKHHPPFHKELDRLYHKVSGPCHASATNNKPGGLVVDRFEHEGPGAAPAGFGGVRIAGHVLAQHEGVLRLDGRYYVRRWPAAFLVETDLVAGRYRLECRQDMIG